MRTPPIIVLGGGGHARVILDVLLARGYNVVGFVDQNPDKPDMAGFSRLGGFGIIGTQFSTEETMLANGLGSVAVPVARMEWYTQFRETGYRFMSCIHPGSIVSPSARLAHGVQVMAGAVIQPGAIVGENTLINTRASVDHDCRIGAHVHLAPGVTLSGEVMIGSRTHIGTGASVIQGVKIGKACTVGAGSVVIRDVPDGATVMGVPAG